MCTPKQRQDSTNATTIRIDSNRILINEIILANTHRRGATSAIYECVVNFAVFIWTRVNKANIYSEQYGGRSHITSRRIVRITRREATEKKTHRKGSGCVHAIYSMRSTVDQCVSYGSTVNICALDVSKAFYRMWDEVGWSVLYRRLGVTQVVARVRRRQLIAV